MALILHKTVSRTALKFIFPDSRAKIIIALNFSKIHSKGFQICFQA
jgi:hypothetical protein